MYLLQKVHDTEIADRGDGKKDNSEDDKEITDDACCRRREELLDGNPDGGDAHRGSEPCKVRALICYLVTPSQQTLRGHDVAKKRKKSRTKVVAGRAAREIN